MIRQYQSQFTVYSVDVFRWGGARLDQADGLSKVHAGIYKEAEYCIWQVIITANCS